MKKDFAVLAVLALSGATALAQSSVTLYGAVDGGIGRIKVAAPNGNDDNGRTQMIAGSLMNHAASHIGFRGLEDLGGGLKAGFAFETNLDLDNGSNLTTGSGFWGRTSRLWFEGPWGSFQMGRTYNPSFWSLVSWQLTGAATYSVVGSTYGWGGGGPRDSSLISYRTPNLSGFSAELGYVMKADKLVGGQQRAKWDVNARYTGGPLTVGLGVNRLQGSKTNYGLGGRYKLGAFSIAASYSQSARVDALRRGFSLGGQASFGATTLTLDVTRDTRNDWGVKKYTNALAEGRYALSKRTFFYAAYLRLDGRNNWGVGVRHNF